MWPCGGRGLDSASVKARLEMIRNLEAWTEDTETCQAAPVETDMYVQA